MKRGKPSYVNSTEKQMGRSNQREWGSREIHVPKKGAFPLNSAVCPRGIMSVPVRASAQIKPYIPWK